MARRQRVAVTLGLAAVAALAGVTAAPASAAVKPPAEQRLRPGRVPAASRKRC
jgi:hypothetical protein